MNRFVLLIRLNSLSIFSTAFGRISRHKERRDSTTNRGSTVWIAWRNSDPSTIDSGNARPITRSFVTILDNSTCRGWPLVYFVPRGLTNALLIDGCFDFSASSFSTNRFTHCSWASRWWRFTWRTQLKVESPDFLTILLHIKREAALAAIL